MRIRYENTIEDFVALARFHNDHSPAARRVRVRATWIFAVSTLAITAVLANMMWEAKGGPILVALTVGSLLTALLSALIRLPGGYRRHAERQARRMYAEGANKGLLGSRELELVGNELVSRSSHGESQLRLEAVERVVVYDGYTLIFINAVTAHVIPHDSVSEGDPEAFAEAVKKRLG